MGTVYIDRKGCHIKLDGNTLAIHVDGRKEGTIPLEPIRRILFIGDMTIETSALRKLAESGITCIFLSVRRLRFAGMLHGSLHSNGILRLRQYQNATSEFARKYAQEIVTRKTEAQKCFLEDAVTSKPSLRFAIQEPLATLARILQRLHSETLSIETLKGLEGSASSAYFSGYTKLFPESLSFNRRTRRPPRDPVNAMLSLCYTLLHTEVVSEIEALGLDPTIGFYHQFEYGRESLACDIVELFRCEVDRLVWRLFTERSFVADDFFKDSRSGGCYLKKTKRKKFYPIYHEWAKSIRRSIAEELRALSRRILDEKDTIHWRK